MSTSLVLVFAVFLFFLGFSLFDIHPFSQRAFLGTFSAFGGLLILVQAMFIVRGTAIFIQEPLHLSTLYQVSQALLQPLESSEFCYEVKRILKDGLGYSEFCLYLFDETEKFFEAFVSSGSVLEKCGTRCPAGQGFIGRVALAKSPIVSEDSSLIGLPLSVSEKLEGILVVFHPRAGSLKQAELQLLEAVANLIGLAYDRSRLYMKTKVLSVVDELTGLYNRRHFQEMLYREWRRAVRFSRPLSLLMIDVDYFKDYNDRFGHLWGDGALQLLAKTISSHVREVDTAARFGGEEFVIILPDTTLTDALTVAHKLRHVIEKSFHLFADSCCTPINFTVSIGASSYPEDAQTSEDLINKADMALYGAKKAGRNCVMSFTPSSDEVLPSQGKEAFRLRVKPQARTAL